MERGRGREGRGKKREKRRRIREGRGWRGGRAREVTAHHHMCAQNPVLKQFLMGTCVYVHMHIGPQLVHQ